jgi:hypothetical protein
MADDPDDLVAPGVLSDVVNNSLPRPRILKRSTLATSDDLATAKRRQKLVFNALPDVTSNQEKGDAVLYSAKVALRLIGMILRSSFSVYLLVFFDISKK